MNTYKLDNTFDNAFDVRRSLLQVYTGDRISENEAQRLLRRIADHKWYVSEKLDRDVGFHVAAIDYVENFYEPQRINDSPISDFLAKTGKTVGSFLKAYFTAKGNAMPI